jgi:sec-independent protein translocase protein TatA
MDVGAPELIVILFIVLLIFGPGRIVKVGHELGEGIRQFKQGLETSAEHETNDENRSTSENGG